MNYTQIKKNQKWHLILTEGDVTPEGLEVPEGCISPPLCGVRYSGAVATSYFSPGEEVCKRCLKVSEKCQIKPLAIPAINPD